MKGVKYILEEFFRAFTFQVLLIFSIVSRQLMSYRLLNIVPQNQTGIAGCSIFSVASVSESQ